MTAPPPGQRPRALTLAARTGAAVGLGVLLVFAFPPYGWWPLAPVAVAGLTLLCHRQSPRSAAAWGGAFGLAFFLGLMPWLRVIGPDAWLALSVFCAGWLALLGVGLALVSRLPGWPLWSALLWVGQEALRDRVPLGGYPWGRLAFAQADAPFAGLSSLGGLPLVTGAVALAAGLLAAAVLAVLEGRRWPGALALVGAVAVTVVGAAVPLPVDGAPVTAAVVQGNVPRTGLDAFGQREAVLRNHAEATTQLAADVASGRVPAPDLVIWPENSSDIDPFRSADAFATIDTAVRAVGAPTLVGLVVLTPDEEALLNLGVVWDPVDGPGEQYAKRHPVPFGEYVPFRAQLAPLISRFDRVPRDFRAGDGPGVLTMGPATVGDVICFEVAYDEVVRDVVRAGADVLAVQTNNATYGRTGQVEQQLAMARLRAVEHGRTVLVAATSGISAVLAPDGSVVARAEEFTQEVLVAEVPRRSVLTPASRVGAWPELLLAALGLAAVVVASVRSRRTTAAMPASSAAPTPQEVGP